MELDDVTVASISQKYGNVSNLNLSNNNIHNLGSIGKLTSLSKLNLSCNSIFDLRPLASLTKITHMDLHQNQISRLDGLESLSLLEMLDLSHNLLPSLDSLQPILRLRKLVRLDLLGNPITMKLDYPEGIFRAISSLRFMDSWERDQVVLREPPSTRPAVALSTAEEVPSSSRSTPLPAALPHLVEGDAQALTVQVQALTRALTLQEHFVSSHAKQQFMKRVYSINKQLVLPAPAAGSRVRAAALSPAALPYDVLLLRWREQVVKLLLQHAVRDRCALHTQQRTQTRLDRLTREHQASEQQLETTRAAYQALTLHCAALDEQMHRLADQHAHLQQHCAEMSRMRDEAVAGLHGLAKQVLQLSSWLAGEWVAVEKGQRTLRTLAQRVEAARDHIAFLQEVWREQRVVDRNTSAADFFLRRVSGGTDPSPSPSLLLQAGGEAGPAGLAHVCLAAEAEACLRGIFRALDPADQGTVAPSALHALCARPEVRGLLVEALGEAATSEVVRALAGLAAGPGGGGDLTFGEFLLLLLPPLPPPPGGRPEARTSSPPGQGGAPPAPALVARLRGENTSRTFRNLHRLHLLLDTSWGVPPFHLPAPPGVPVPGPPPPPGAGGGGGGGPPSSGVGGGATSSGVFSTSSGVFATPEEVSRLRAERAYLLARLQGMARQWDQRVQGVHSYYANELLGQSLAMQAAADEGHALRGRVEERDRDVDTLRTQLGDVCAQRAAEQEEAARREAALRQEVHDLQQQLQQQHRAGDASFASAARPPPCEARLGKLTAEHDALLRDHAKLAVRCKGLERELVRRQMGLDEVRGELAEARDQAREARQRGEAAAQAWAAERQAKDEDLRRLTQRLALLEARDLAPDPAQPPPPSPPPPPPAPAGEDRGPGSGTAAVPGEEVGGGPEAGLPVDSRRGGTVRRAMTADQMRDHVQLLLQRAAELL